MPTDRNLIQQISEWYFNEWQISKELTVSRLAVQSPDDIIFHLNLFEGDVPVSTGGLYRNVGLLHVHPEFKKYGPWVALVYTVSNKRGLGLGGELLKAIEERGAQLGFEWLYLYTYTAQNLYERNGWIVFDKAEYKNHEVVVMKKSLARIR